MPYYKIHYTYTCGKKTALNDVIVVNAEDPVRAVEEARQEYPEDKNSEFRIRDINKIGD